MTTTTKTTNFLRHMVLSVVPFVCAFSFASLQASAQNSGTMGAHLQTVVYDGSTRAGWYSFPGQQPKLRFKGDLVNITSRKHSTVLLSRLADSSTSAAEVSLTRAPISTSSISGLAVLSDAQHALVIGLEGGSVVLWDLNPDAARVLARQPVNSSSPLEFRVSGNQASSVRFFWRHQGDSAWHPLGDADSAKLLNNWRDPIHFGLLLDGPQGSQVTFSNYRAVSADMARNSMPATLINGR
ncbi:MAG: hypothetical protein WA708_18760 [Acidobacteriaceae bacterium]